MVTADYRVYSIAEIKPQLALEEKRKHHAEYMRNWRKEHPQYAEEQKVGFKRFLERHPDYLYNYNKKWRKGHPKNVLEMTRRYRQRHPEKRAEQRAKYAERHPDRNFARHKALALKPSRCSFCGSYDQIERHHPDYSQPLLIRPLCHDCHVNLHRQEKIAIEVEVSP